MTGVRDRANAWAASLPAERRRSLELLLLVFLLMIPLTIGSSTTIFNDGDVSWHLAAGRWILDNRAVPSADPFSFTFGGKPWVAFEWLSQLLYASAYRLAGYGGVAALVTLALVLLNVQVIADARRFLAPLAVAATILALNVVLVPFVLARPHVLAWPLLALWIAILMRARDARRAPPLGWALLMCLWINLHGSWALGMAIAAAFALEAMIESKWDARQFRGWLLFGLAALAAAAFNANGLAGLLHPFKVSQFEHLPLIEEWRPSDPRVTPGFAIVLLATLVLMLWRGVRLSLVRALILAGMLGLALLQARHQAPLAIVAAMLLPRALASAKGKQERGALFGDAHERRLVLGLGAIALAVLIGGRMTMPIMPDENGSNPRGLIAAVPDELRNRPMLNGYSFGGPLILAGIKPYIDGRSDMYGDAFVKEYKAITDGDAAAFRRAVERWDLQWAMTPFKYERLVGLLDREPGWRRIHADAVGVIHVRSAAEPSASGSLRDRRGSR